MTATLHLTSDWTRWLIVAFIAWVCLLLLAAVWWSWLMERRSRRPEVPREPTDPYRGVEVTTVPLDWAEKGLIGPADHEVEGW